MMVYACDLNIQEVEAEAEALEIQGYLRLSRPLLAILGYMRLSPTPPPKKA